MLTACFQLKSSILSLTVGAPIYQFSGAPAKLTLLSLSLTMNKHLPIDHPHSLAFTLPGPGPFKCPCFIIRVPAELKDLQIPPLDYLSCLCWSAFCHHNKTPEEGKISFDS